MGVLHLQVGIALDILYRYRGGSRRYDLGNMKSRLNLCCQYLGDVKTRLVELLDSSESATERIRIAEAISFLEQATRAVSEAQNRIDDLPEEAKRLHA
jgi:hypothetical protein